jgi:hypothetical protein
MTNAKMPGRSKKVVKDVFLFLKTILLNVKKLT